MRNDRELTLAMDDAVSLRREATQCLQHQNDRLQLLLKLTNSITANLELKEVLRAITANVREVMRCDAVNISVAGPDPGTFRLYAVDFPGSTGFVKEEQIVTQTEDSPAKRAIETLKPVIATPGDHPPGSYGHKIAVGGES
jgi:formate hydrogenlyase transcriptional activator